ncbi:hypothetical protein GCM10023187_53430 [Nibrella viscosa]|uniref:Uncharacterized protein n=1 Tax=Nibrella viscosa TaxID=1084524 RepID=A0ABP8KYL9_9BACT
MIQLKKKVTEDWQNAFPELAVYSQNKFYKIVGPTIIGLELVKLPRTEDYRPYFICYPLWKQNIKTCLDNPIIIKEFNNKKGMLFSIPYAKHTAFFSDVLSEVKKQIPIPFEGDVSLKKLFSTIDEYSKTSYLSAAPNSYLQAVLQESKLALALCTSNDDQVRSILSHIQKSNWDVAHFAMWKVDVSQWLNQLQKMVENREELIFKVKQNKQEKKLEKLHHSKLEA